MIFNQEREKSDEKMQPLCCAYDTNDHVRQHRLANIYCARQRGMGDVFLEPHLLEIEKTLKFGVEFQKRQNDGDGLRALQALSLTLNFKSIIKRVCNYINLTLPWRRQSLPFEMQQFTHCIKDYKLKGRLKLSDNSLTVVMTYFI